MEEVEEEEEEAFEQEEEEKVEAEEEEGEEVFEQEEEEEEVGEDQLVEEEQDVEECPCLEGSLCKSTSNMNSCFSFHLQFCSFVCNPLPSNHEQASVSHQKICFQQQCQ